MMPVSLIARGLAMQVRELPAAEVQDAGQGRKLGLLSVGGTVYKSVSISFASHFLRNIFISLPPQHFQVLSSF